MTGGEITSGILVAILGAYLVWAVRENVRQIKAERAVRRSLTAYEEGEISRAQLDAVVEGKYKYLRSFGVLLEVGLLDAAEEADEARAAVDKAVRTGKGIPEARIALRRAHLMWREEREDHYRRLALAEAKVRQVS